MEPEDLAMSWQATMGRHDISSGLIHMKLRFEMLATMWMSPNSNAVPATAIWMLKSLLAEWV